MDWHIGCSGFHYKDWRERFYPKGLAQKNWFEYYCQHFSTIELNVTHYKFPEIKSLSNWYQKSPQDFSFAIKMFKGITHFKKLNECKPMVDEFYHIVHEGLREKAACILFQFPPSFHYNEKNISRILNNVNPFFNNVVEFRHNSWWNEKVYDVFSKNKIIFCGMSHPSLPDVVIKTQAIIYYRFHGVPQLYASLYSMADLKEVVTNIKSINPSGVFAYFNNDIKAAAIRNAVEMKELV